MSADPIGMWVGTTDAYDTVDCCHLPRVPEPGEGITYICPRGHRWEFRPNPAPRSFMAELTTVRYAHGQPVGRWATLDRWRRSLPLCWWLLYDALVGVALLLAWWHPWAALIVGIPWLGIAAFIDLIEYMVKSGRASERGSDHERRERG